MSIENWRGRPRGAGLFDEGRIAVSLVHRFLMFGRLDDTIVAVSSPAGRSVRAVIRLSGPEAFALASAVFAGEAGRLLGEMPGHHRMAGRVILADGASVPGEAYVFRAPASYTRQDVVELHTVGSPPVLAIVLDRLTDEGARPAEPGEFTARAFFSGAMDLTRVEGVAAVIHARSDAQLRASQALLHGRLSRRMAELRDRLADLLALLEAEIDFVEEPICFVTRDQVLETLDAVSGEIGALLRDSVGVERLDILPEVALVGRPNAGKSTLFNRLTGMDRAICSATAGTTRDVLAGPVTVPGGEVTLLDGAGLETDPLAGAGSCSQDVSARAQAASRRAIASADLVLLVLDVTDAPGRTCAALQAMLPERPMLLVANKIDAVPGGSRAAWIAELGAGGEAIAVSARTGEGLETLRSAVARMLFSEAPAHGSDILALSNHQRRGLSEARDALVRARRLCDEADEPLRAVELLALEVREAVGALSVLIGEVTTEDLLERVFARFCIGK